MISQEPYIKVGVFERTQEAKGTFQGKFAVSNVIGLTGDFHVRSERGTIIFTKSDGQQILSEQEIECQPLDQGTFTLKDVVIGIGFHWERKENQTFEGRLRLVAQENHAVAAINELSVESYLKSVISSEMSATAPIELLKAHAITSRSWLVAMLDRQSKQKASGLAPQHTQQSGAELIRWYDREDHTLFDVCADDHCQRYQGLSKIISQAASDAIQATRGQFLVHDGEICDARYYKACGGLTENYENVWDEQSVPYLKSISDSTTKHRALRNEQDAERWMNSSPDAFCNTTDGSILRQVLPSFDQETTDFFRWKVEYKREDLEALIKQKSGIDFGELKELIPVKRGPSGRIYKLKIVGSKQTMVVGKELEIRKWLSKSHLYSSAFVVRTEPDSEGRPSKFVLLGSGWGHGVGLCQIGAAVMATKGYKAEQIVKHYFPGAELETLY